MGRLFVFLVDEAKYKKRLFFRERHQGDRWKRANVRIPKDAPNGYRVSGHDEVVDLKLGSLVNKDRLCRGSGPVGVCYMWLKLSLVVSGQLLDG